MLVVEESTVYLRRVRFQDGWHYVLRKSFWGGGCWRHRDLMDLGSDPEAYIVYPGGNGFYFKPELEEALEAKGVQWETDDLEEVFLPFLDPHIRRIVTMFRAGPAPSRWAGCSQEELLEHQKGLHAFDKRRLHYLRCGRVDIGKLDDRPWKFLNVLLEKSRDEIEHVFESMEAQLRPHEVRPYLFTALHLQSYFPQHLLKNQPAALDPEKVDDYFLEEICHLNADPAYLKGLPHRSGGRLHPYLVRYVILYFDHAFTAEALWNDTLRGFIGSRGFYRPPRPSAAMPIPDACRILGISREEFETMSVRDLTRCFKRRAMAHHPDRGGDHEAFIRTTRAYEELLLRKGRSRR
ncbi:MAG: J domain-containing protein [Thermodesulfobacteriota bacterium]|nr:J domain-containing protein [Thermodesulfobacteriota bacterium]